VTSVGENGVVRRRASSETVAVCVRYRAVSSGGFIGQICTMVLPHGGPEAFIGGPAKAAMIPHLLGCRCLVGALAYLASLRSADGGLRSDFYPEVLLDVVDFPQFAPFDTLVVPVGSFVFGEGSLADRAFSCDCEEYLMRVVAQHLRFAGHHEDRVVTQRCRLLSALLSRKAARASSQDFAVLQHAWDTVVRGRSFREAPKWSEDQLAFFCNLDEQLDLECVWDLDANVRKRRCFLSGPPGTGKPEVLVHAGKLAVDRGCRVLFLLSCTLILIGFRTLRVSSCTRSMARCGSVGSEIQSFRGAIRLRAFSCST
jgi:hypothetical protein